MKKDQSIRYQKVYIVIPAYNEAEKINDVVGGVLQFSKNIIVIDDGSKDRTGQIVKKLGVTVLRHQINLGKGAAMKTGVEAAILLGAKQVLFMDADGQHNPRDIPKLLKKLNYGNDIVFGTRDLSAGIPFFRLIGNKACSFLIGLLFGLKRQDLLCGFFCFNTDIYQNIYWDATRYGVETEIVARTGHHRLKYAEVQIDTIYYDKYKGVTLFDAIGVMLNIPRFKICTR